MRGKVSGDLGREWRNKRWEYMWCGEAQGKRGEETGLLLLRQSVWSLQLWSAISTKYSDFSAPVSKL